LNVIAKVDEPVQLLVRYSIVLGHIDVKSREWLPSLEMIVISITVPAGTFQDVVASSLRQTEHERARIWDIGVNTSSHEHIVYDGSQS
jgi:hypothetical protein